MNGKTAGTPCLVLAAVVTGESNGCDVELSDSQKSVTERRRMLISFFPCEYILDGPRVSG